MMRLLLCLWGLYLMVLVDNSMSDCACCGISTVVWNQKWYLQIVSFEGFWRCIFRILRTRLVLFFSEANRWRVAWYVFSVKVGVFRIFLCKNANNCYVRYVSRCPCYLVVYSYSVYQLNIKIRHSNRLKTQNKWEIQSLEEGEEVSTSKWERTCSLVCGLTVRK